MRRFLSGFLAGLFLLSFSSYLSAGVVTAKLVLDHTQIRPSQTVKAGVLLTMPEGWHIYGEHPGDLGQPTTIVWKLPEGWTYGGIDWPKPIEFEVSGFKSFGYEKQVFLVSELRVPANAIESDAAIVATVEWIACEKLCIPESVTLNASVKVSLAGDVKNLEWKNPVTQVTPVNWKALVKWILGAFIGGVILNLMPCVFPVLSLKILGFVRQAAASRKEIFYHGLMFSAGVMATFLSLAGILVGLRSVGAQIGWGFQLQSSVVVLGLAGLFVLLGLMMLDVFHVGTSLGRLQQLTVGKSGIGAAFWNGVLAVVVATPCTAPFMGSAIGAALSQPGIVTWAVFISLGLGMSMPYLLLSIFPGWLQHLPKPGIWMVRMKQILAIPMFLTAIWLGWIYFSQSGSASHTSATYQQSKFTVETHVFSEEKLSQLRADGRIVLVDVTAAWCLTCKVNEKTVLHRKEIQQLFKDNNVVVLIADWTRKDDEITRYLAGFQRSGVPLVVVYFPGKEPKVLPSILTMGGVKGLF
jgi:thiol:disulfide interchange protein